MTRDEAEAAYRATCDRMGTTADPGGALVGPDDLAQRLAAHPRWVWQPGMVDTDGRVVVAYQPGPARIVMSEMVPYEEPWEAPFERCSSVYVRGAIPDIHHPATRGWLLAMLREATGDAGAHAALMMPLGTQCGGWAVYSTRPLPATPGATEGDALAAALLAVWGAQ